MRKMSAAGGGGAGHDRGGGQGRNAGNDRVGEFSSLRLGGKKGHKQTVELMCQEYVIRTDTTEYHVRQEKEAHKEMLPVNAPVELTLSKDKMKFKVNGKGYEMLVVSESAAPASTSPANH